MRSAHPRSSPTPQPLSAAQPCLRQQKSPQRGSVEPHRPKSATNGHSQHQARDGARANLAGLGARGPGAEGTYPPDYPSCARNPPRLPTLWPPTAFIMANWATCGRAERASKKARLPGESRVCVVCEFHVASGSGSALPSSAASERPACENEVDSRPEVDSRLLRLDSRSILARTELRLLFGPL